MLYLRNLHGDSQYRHNYDIMFNKITSGFFESYRKWKDIMWRMAIELVSIKA